MLPDIKNGSYFTSCKRNKIALIMFSVFMLAFFTGLTVFTNAAYITDNGETKFVFTMTDDANTILGENGYVLGEFDEVIVGEKSSQIRTIEILRAVKAQIVKGDSTIETMTTAKTVGELLADNGITLAEEDEITPSADEAVTDGTVITIIPALSVKIKADGVEKTVSVKNGTVADALAKAGVSLDADDKASFALTDALHDGMEITVNRIETKEVTETVEIPFASTTVNSSLMVKDQKTVTTAGVNGSKQVVRKVTYSDGAEIASELISETVITQPVNEVVTVGTAANAVNANAAKVTAGGTASIGSGVISPAPASVQLDANGLPVNYTRVITGKTSAYTSAPTAHVSCGQVANIGLVAVNPNIIPYGTEMYIVAADGSVYGYAVAADTGGALMRGKVLVDLYMGPNNSAVCYQWGIRNATIYILN